METAQLDVQVLAALSGTVIPILVGLVTKRVASSGTKAVLNAFLSAVAGALAVAIEAEGQVELGQWIWSIASTWAVSVATYYGLWKPTGVTPAIQNATAGFGLGGSSRAEAA